MPEMPTKTVSIQFSEQSKAVVCDIKIEYHGDVSLCPSNEEVLKEAKELFVEAYRFAQPYSMQKARQ